tara:strand:+ start:131 stop:517 length:387 start_codon:yes stop_codon:yes gene_type:complete
MSEKQFTLEVVSGRYAVCQLDAVAEVPGWVSGAVTSVTRTPAELSIICSEECVPGDVRSESGWRCLRVVGPLEFSMVGVIASLTGVLADAGVSVFVVSTFDTDCLLVKQAHLEMAVKSLTSAGHSVSL